MLHVGSHGSWQGVPCVDNGDRVCGRLIFDRFASDSEVDSLLRIVKHGREPQSFKAYRRRRRVGQVFGLEAAKARPVSSIYSQVQYPMADTSSMFTVLCNRVMYRLSTATISRRPLLYATAPNSMH